MLDKRRIKPQTSKPVTTASAHPAGARAVPAMTAAAAQLASFEAAMRFFHERKLREARELFVGASHGPESDVAQRANLHIAMCDRRLEHATVSLGTAEDYYNYGVALINTRKIAEARTHLERALELTPAADHIHYALALAQALGGDPVSAYANLKRAIELEPRNRMLARQDADFAPLAHQPPFDALLYPERHSWPERKGW
jgi:tetratricopeptide (TPR) repeat protein